MSRPSSRRFVPTLESFEGRLNLSPVGVHALYQDISIPTATQSRDDSHRETIEIQSWSLGAVKNDYSAIVFVGGWGSSM